MTDSRSTLDDEVDDEPIGDSRETCILWVSRSGECRREAAPFTGSEPCPDCPLAGDAPEGRNAEYERYAYGEPGIRL